MIESGDQLEVNPMMCLAQCLGSFLFGVAMFLAALLCFLRETLLAVRVLDVHVKVN